jgi:hypothetical protein
MNIPRVKNKAVWHQIKIFFLGSAFLFLANIYFGFDNSLNTEFIPRWQTLVHVHSGALGWVTLSVIAIAIWLLTGDREVSVSYRRKVQNLAWFGIWIFGGYIIVFGLAFAGLGRIFTIILPILGFAATLYIWVTAFFSLAQLRQQDVITTGQLLITASLWVASLGSTMGLLLGLEYVIGFFLPGPDRIAPHGGTMDTYLLLAAAAIVEMFLQKDAKQRWNRSGMFITVAWSLAMVSILGGLLLGILPLVMTSVPLMLLAMIVFVIRGGWRALKLSPFRKGPGGWIFFGTLWMIFWGMFFIWVAANYAEDPTLVPHWVAVTFVHGSFVGMMTNLLLAAYSARSREASEVLSWAELPAVWLTNLGLLVFLGIEIASGGRLGAAVMGVGVLLGLLTMILRLRASNS